MKLLRKILLIGALGFLGCLTVFFGYYLTVTSGVRLDENKLLLPDTRIVVYDNSGKMVAGVGSFDQRNVVSIDDLPAYLPTAFVNTEDKRFYRHNGFDVIGIARASIRNLKSGSFKEGASTISQQLIKNTHLTLDKTVRRKLKEFKLTSQLERKYSKRRILETYLNTIYFGHSCYGIADAARFYFDKSASDLTLAESAMLAGLVKSPNNYSPFKNPEKAYLRRKVVLNLMKEQNSLTESEYTEALNTPLPATSSQINARSYAHFAIQEMDRIFDLSGEYSSGKIELFTYLDPVKQAYLEAQRNASNTDKSFAVINNYSRGIEAFYSTVSLPCRSPGSLIKPLLVYAPAIEEGIISPASLILDEETAFGDYKPKNYGGKYFGYVSVRDAISKSLNVPAVKVLNSLTVEKARVYAEKLDLNIPKNDQNLAFALGGMERGYSFINLLDGFCTLANDGSFLPSRFIKEMKINGKSVYQAQTKPANVFSPETAYLITDTLKTAACDGTAKKLRSLPFPVAAKTGTVGTKQGDTDAYTVAYTSEHTIGVWLGNADRTPIDTTGGGAPCSICKSVLEKLYADHTPDDFERPIGIKEVSIDRYSYKMRHRILLSDPLSPIAERQTELFINRFAPKEQSTIFTRPSASSPTISVSEAGITVLYQTPPPDIYRYKIFREENGKKQLVYDGNRFEKFLDKKIKPNTLYKYTVIPYYNETDGEAIVLPSVYSKDKTPLPPIANTPWWED